MNCEPLRPRLCCFKIFPYLHAHQSSGHRKCAEDYPLVLFETMGESPTNCRLKLGGGQRAKRHRAVCNREHCFSPSVRRSRINGALFSSIRTCTMSMNEAPAPTQ